MPSLPLTPWPPALHHTPGCLCGAPECTARTPDTHDIVCTRREHENLNGRTCCRRRLDVQRSPLAILVDSQLPVSAQKTRRNDAHWKLTPPLGMSTHDRFRNAPYRTNVA